MAQKSENFDNEANEPVDNTADETSTTNTADESHKTANAASVTDESAATPAVATTKRAWLKPVGIAAAAVVALGVAFGAGTATAKFMGPVPGDFGAAHVQEFDRPHEGGRTGEGRGPDERNGFGHRHHADRDSSTDTTTNP